LIRLTIHGKEHVTVFKKPDEEYIKEGAEKVTSKDIQTVDERAEEINNKFSARGPLKRFIEDGRVLTALVRDWRAGNYRQALYGTIAAVVFGLIYVFNPFDLVPDILPFVGALDDATVIGALLMLVERDLKKYRSWKENQPMRGDRTR
jgi:uncharacterized membrane protein YkvA (DUF1232 family)